MNISTFDELVLFLDADLKKKSMHPVRIIHTECINHWIQVKKYLMQKCESHVKLSHYCRQDDLLPNIRRLRSKLLETCKNTLIIPLSEHLRIDNDNIYQELKNFLDIKLDNVAAQNQWNIYIPLYRMSNSIVKMIKDDIRLRDRIIFLKAAQEELIEEDYYLTIISKEIDVRVKGHPIKGYKHYLQYWEDEPAKPVILFTDNAKYYKHSIYEDNVKVLVNAFDILLHHKMLPYNIEEHMGKDYFWKELLNHLKTGTDFNKILGSMLMDSVSIYKLLSLFNKINTKEFAKWMIWLWFKFEAKDEYIRMVMDKNQSYDRFENDLFCGILDMDRKKKEFSNLYKERKNLLKALNRPLPKEFIEKLNSIKESDRIYYLTDNTKEERELIISIIGKQLKNKKALESLKEIYPYLYDYLKDYEFDYEQFTEYFREYKRQKLANNFTDSFIKEVNEIAESCGIWWKYSLKSRNCLLTGEYGNNSLIFWIDALGVEYLGFIQSLLDTRYNGVSYAVLTGYANLPTTTEYNKDFVKDREYELISSLDQLKHKGVYPQCIEEELRIIIKAIDEAVKKLENYDSVIITSDHGASRGAVLHKESSLKADDGAKVESFGRYCIQEGVAYSERYHGCLDQEEYHIFANYNRFSIGGNEQSEIHGGGSLEEVLVPIIVLYKKQPPARITLPERVIMLKPGKKLKVRFQVDKNYTEIDARVGFKKYQCKKEQDYWYFEPEIDKQTDKYKVKLISKGTIGEFEFKVQKGLSKSDKFDI